MEGVRFDAVARLAWAGLDDRGIAEASGIPSDEVRLCRLVLKAALVLARRGMSAGEVAGETGLSPESVAVAFAGSPSLTRRLRS